VTFSIVARGASTAGDTAWGVAVASRFLAVGAAVPAARAGVGAVATQAWANLAYRTDGLASLARGQRAEQALDALISADDRREHRQAGIVDAHGQAATWTGARCHAWAGGISDREVAIQGNILTGPEVVDAMHDAWRSTPGEPLARRLLGALAAGDAAGGDRRGRQSAALLVVTPDGGYGGGSDVFVDLRVDDSTTPVAELQRLLDLHDLYFGKPDPATLLPLEGELAAEVERRVRQLGYADLDAWMGVENYEERAVAGSIDPVVLQKLREASDR
jgi:uncharacterized Ntn-hydrolase superfamily protein